MSQSFAYVKVPKRVFDALADKHITTRMFQILAWLHRWADFRTGIVASVSAKRLAPVLGLDPDKDERTIQRDMRTLRRAGWYTWDYVGGSKRPYFLTLSNYPVYVMKNAETAFRHENVAEDIGEEILLNQCEIVPYQEALKFNDADNVAHNVADVSANNQYPQGGKADSSSQPIVSALDAVLKRAYDLTGVPLATKDQKAAPRLTKQFPVKEVIAALDEFLDFTTINVENSRTWLESTYSRGEAKRRLKEFFTEGRGVALIAIQKQRLKSERHAKNVERAMKTYLEMSEDGIKPIRNTALIKRLLMRGVSFAAIEDAHRRLHLTVDNNPNDKTFATWVRQGERARRP